MGWTQFLVGTMAAGGLLAASAAGQSDVEALREAKKRAAAAEARSETLRHAGGHSRAGHRAARAAVRRVAVSYSGAAHSTAIREHWPPLTN
jgi:hypothetical protein